MNRWRKVRSKPLSNPLIIQIMGLILLFIPFIFLFYPFLFGEKSFFYRDIFRYFFPYKEFVSEATRAAELPLWNPFVYAGYPAFSGIQSQILYPLSFIHIIFPFSYGFKLFIVAHYIIASLGSYFYIKYILKDRLSATLAGIIYAYAGYPLSLHDLLSSLCTYCWLPWLLLLYTHGIKKNKLFLFLSSIIYSIQFLGGEPTLWLASGITIFLLSVFYSSSVGIKKAFLYFCMFFIFSISLLSFQLLGLFELLIQSSRYPKVTEYEGGSICSLRFEEFKACLLPYYFSYFIKPSYITQIPSQAWLVSIYYGIWIIILAILGLFSKVNLKYLFLLILILGIHLSLGENNPLYTRFLKEEVLFLLRFPIRFFFYIHIGLSFLAAFGIHTINNTRKFPLFSLVLTSIIAFELILVGKKTLINLDDNFYKDKPDTVKILEILSDTTNRERFLLGPSTEDCYYQEKYLDYVSLYKIGKLIILPNTHLRYRIYSISGFESIELKRVSKLLELIGDDPTSPILDLVSVNYVLSIFMLPSEKWELIHFQRGAKIFRNKEAYPPCFFVKDAVFTKNSLDLFKDWLNKKNIFLYKIILEE